MRRPTTYRVDWYAIDYCKGDDKIWLALEAKGKVKCYAITGEQFREFIKNIKIKGFRE